MKFEGAYAARIAGPHIECTFQPDRALDVAVFCFSCLAPMKVVAGGQKVRGVGGYTEVALPPLAEGQPHQLILAHEAAEFVPVNRAWLPLGPYLRADGQVLDLPPGPAGVQARAWAGPPEADVPLRLCPQPHRFTATGGTLRAEAFACSSDRLDAVDRWSQRLGQPALLGDSGVALDLHERASLPAEGYGLTIGPAGCRIEFADAAGLFYAGVTLATLRHTHGGVLPCGVMEDVPRFAWRGQHLDCARHFYAVEFILRLLDLMALLKLNRFHWHFADDEAFRLSLDSLPELAQTHVRGEGCLIPGVFGGGARSGGAYSKADVQRVVAHARALQIEILPEIDLPAHALALTTLYPDTRDPEDTGQEVSVQGYGGNVMNPAQDASWRVWQAMAREVAALFPFGHVHLGGDELPEDTWMRSPAAQALMRAEGLKTPHDLLGWTLNRLAAYLRTLGARPAAWEEVALGCVGIENAAILFSWSGQARGLAAARAGYKVVMTPAQHTYFDMAHTDDPDDWGANWAAYIDLAATVNWDPVPEDAPELEANILGVQGAFWSEFTTADREAEAMIFPRILGLATKAWQPRAADQVGPLRALSWAYEGLLARAGWASAGALAMPPPLAES